MTHSANVNSAFARQRHLAALIASANLGPEVLDELLPNGSGHLFEPTLWDYKKSVPTSVRGRSLTEEEKTGYNAGMAEVVKDVVSFYNSLGGYLVIGVHDITREAVGFEALFDCDDLNQKVKGATRHDVSCMFASHNYLTSKGPQKVCLLFIPRRPDPKEPAQFLRDAPTSATGKKAYKAGDIYFREGNQCRPASSAEDYVYLCAPGRRQVLAAEFLPPQIALDNNLGARDPSFVRFVGRQEYLDTLWRWLCDQFSPIKLLAAQGGIGKTTIAREFAEEIMRAAPMGFERLIWLSAKPMSYPATLDKYVRNPRVDFTDLRSLLRALLGELGWPKQSLDNEATTEELVEQTVDSLLILPSFLVIDDIDSLAPVEQHDVFHRMIQITTRTMGSNCSPSRVLLTSRLDLGAAIGQLIPVKGLPLNEFSEYVEVMATSLNIPWKQSTKVVSRFHKVTEGSPIFAASVLRLVALGETLNNALEKWRGSAGEEVRKFAFQRELQRLSDSQIRTLFAICTFGETSSVELRQVLEVGEVLLSDDLAELRKYHLLALGHETSGGGYRLIAPAGVRLMLSLIRNRVRDPVRIETDCQRLRAGGAKLSTDVGTIVRRALALWRDTKARDALELLVAETKQDPRNADLCCLLGRAYLEIDPLDLPRADASFRHAHELGCQRPELMSFWIQTKISREDWVSLIEITQIADKQSASADNVYHRARAYRALADLAISRGSPEAAASYFLKGASDIDEAFRGERAKGRGLELNELRAYLFESHVALIDSLNGTADNHVYVWLAVVAAFDGFVRKGRLIRLGLDRLSSWWSAVEQREQRDEKAVRLLEVQLDKLGRMIGALRGQKEPDTHLLQVMTQAHAMLVARLPG